MSTLEVSSAPDHLFPACALYSSKLPLAITAGTWNSEGTEVLCLPSLLLHLSSPLWNKCAPPRCANAELLNTQTAFWEC